jgi:DNA (cytosine-5)-methyltransferase 1
MGAKHAKFRGLRSVDICSGLGGFSIAARLLGMKPIAAADVWQNAADVYQQNFPEADFTVGDVTSEATLATIAEGARSNGGCDIMTAGPPCQGFSQMRNGRHNVSDPRNEVSRHMPKAVAALEPRAFIIENVPAIFDHQKGAFAARLLQALRRPKKGLRYHVHKAVYDAALFGVPQQRRRGFIIGMQHGEGEISLPHLPEISWYFTARRRNLPVNGYSDDITRILEDPEDLRLVSVKQALGDLPTLGAGAGEEARPYRMPAASAYQRALRGRKRMIMNTATPRILDVTANRLKKLKPGECVTDLPEPTRRSLSRRFMSAYRKLHPELPSTTLFTKIDCAYHPSAIRALSVREYARLQSIPDSFEFPGAPRNAYAMIGNAVPPLLAASLLKQAIQLG